MYTDLGGHLLYSIIAAIANCHRRFTSSNGPCPSALGLFKSVWLSAKTGWWGTSLLQSGRPWLFLRSWIAPSCVLLKNHREDNFYLSLVLINISTFLNEMPKLLFLDFSFVQPIFFLLWRKRIWVCYHHSCPMLPTYFPYFNTCVSAWKDSKTSAPTDLFFQAGQSQLFGMKIQVRLPLWGRWPGEEAKEILSVQCTHVFLALSCSWCPDL